MEDSSLTQVTLDIVRRLHARPELRGSIGIVIQAYLYRSQADIEQLVADGIRVRLCKGAYKEPAEVAFPAKSDVDKNYIHLSHLLLDSPIYHGLATHDEAMIAAARAFATEHHIEPARFEFQMLYGVRRDLQRRPRRQRGLQRARLRALRPRMVPLLHAPPRRAPRQRPLPRQKLLPLISQPTKPRAPSIRVFRRMGGKPQTLGAPCLASETWESTPAIRKAQASWTTRAEGISLRFSIDRRGFRKEPHRTLVRAVLLHLARLANVLLSLHGCLFGR